jgi:LPXTG-motif cell wall-anchored protein
MKNNILYIVGAVALLGGGAFLFLKNKKSKDLSKLKDLELDALNKGTSTQTQTQTPEEVEKYAKKLLDARAIAVKIDNLKTEKRNNILKPKMSGTIGQVKSLVIEKRNIAIDKEISQLLSVLADLGYTESNGFPVKIN